MSRSPAFSAGSDEADVAKQAADRFDGPVVVKAYGKGIVHKSDVGAVRVGVEPAEVEETIAAMAAELHTHGLEADGWLVEEQIAGSVELLVGVVRRPPFGAVVAVGLGGTLTEILDDVVTRLVPIDAADAEAMLDGFKGASVLRGVRGALPVDRDALVKVLLGIAGPDGLADPPRHRPQRARVQPGDRGPARSGGGGRPARAPRDHAHCTRSPPTARHRRAVRAPLHRDRRRVDEGPGFRHTRPRRVPRDGLDGEPVRAPPERDRRSTASRRTRHSRTSPAAQSTTCSSRSPRPPVSNSSASRGVARRVAHVISGGFGETGPDGTALETALVDAARESGVRVLGPNCIGVYAPAGRQTFQLGVPHEVGAVGVVSQSGGLAGDIVKLGAARGLRFSKLVSAGNAVDVMPGELIEHLVDDPATGVIGLLSRRGARR